MKWFSWWVFVWHKTVEKNCRYKSSLKDSNKILKNKSFEKFIFYTTITIRLYVCVCVSVSMSKRLIIHLYFCAPSVNIVKMWISKKEIFCYLNVLEHLRKHDTRHRMQGIIFVKEFYFGLKILVVQKSSMYEISCSQSKTETCIAWKVSRNGVFSGPYFPVFGLNTEIYAQNLWLIVILSYLSTA